MPYIPELNIEWSDLQDGQDEERRRMYIDCQNGGHVGCAPEDLCSLREALHDKHAKEGFTPGCMALGKELAMLTLTPVDRRPDGVGEAEKFTCADAPGRHLGIGCGLHGLGHDPGWSTDDFLKAHRWVGSLPGTLRCLRCETTSNKIAAFHECPGRLAQGG